MRVVLHTLLFLLLCGQAKGQSAQPTKIRVRGVELHYIEQGQGEPLILLHGGQGDYRSWEPQMKVLSPQYRVISYSRRYHYPNDNPLTAKNHSAYVEAADLAAFIRKLKLGRVHLVGTSMGAFTALVLAVKHPEMVRSLVLAEPPVHGWMRDSPDGAPVYREFMTTIHEPVAAAFKAGDDQGAMRIFLDGIAGTRRFDNLPPEGRAAVMQNSRFFKAITSSSDPFPDLSKEKVKRLRIPILIVTGENTIKLHKLVNEELARLLPNAERAIIPKAGHGSPRENPQAFNEAVLKFLANHRPLSEKQTKQEQSRSEQGKNKPKIVALHPNDSESFSWDGGKVRFLASSEDTDGGWAVIEVTERPGYKTPVHRHNHTDEAFYVLEGILTVKINDKTSEYPAGSYVLIPRGTPHAQGNLGKVPVKHLLTVMPGGFERFFRDRIELFKTVKPGDPDFMKKMSEIRQNVDSEVLGVWDVQK